MKRGPNIDIHVMEDPDKLAISAVRIFIQLAKQALDQSRHYNVSISGGSTPRLMHRMLAHKPYVSEMPWEGLHLFWVDERCVPVSDQASNYGTVKKDMLDDLSLSPQQVHPMPGEKDPAEGALSYEKELTRHFEIQAGEFPGFDLIILGVGPDGHTASLFPGQSSLDEKQRLVLDVKGGDPDVNRLTLTLPVINQAKKILVLISGRGKAEIVKSIFQDKKTGLPIQRIQPEEGEMIWLLDKEAVSLL
jgi:6-phosphogluconolactonase